MKFPYHIATRATFIFVVMLLFPLFIIAQEPAKIISSPVFDVLNLNSNGFILGTKKEVVYYNTDGTVRWSAKREFSHGGHLIASPSGKYVYDVNFFEVGSTVVVGSGKRKGPQYITQFDAKGATKALEINRDKGFGKHLQSYYCNDQYFFSLTTQAGNESNDKQKDAEKLILHRYSNEDFSYHKVVLGLPVVEASENSTFWTLIGQGKEGVYLLSKRIDLAHNSVTFNLATIDDNGKMIKSLSIEPVLGDKFVRPAINTEYQTKYRDNSKPFLVLHDMESYWNYLGYPTAEIETMTHGVYAQFSYDPVSNAFYAYGLLGRKPKVSEGFYVMKYDLSGNLVWKLEEIGSKQLLGESHFKNYPTARSRNIKLISLPDSKMIFSISFRDTRYFYEIVEGKVVGTERLQGFPDYQNSGNYLFSTSPMKSQRYLASQNLLQARSKWPEQFVNDETEILLVNSKKDTELVLFKR